MNKEEAISKFGEAVVEKARDMYETDAGKILFEEDCKYEGDYPLSETERDDYLYRAQHLKETK